MDNHDNHLKPQQTGGLKLMTVFIAVLALHVVVIGGITVYHLMSGGSSDSDLATDKAHKAMKIAADGDGSMPDNSSADKTASTATPAPATTPAPETTASNDTGSAPTPAPVVVTPAPDTTTTASTPSGPVTPAPAVTSVVPATTAVSSPTPAPGDVTAQDTTAAPAASEGDTGAGTPYTVKSHDSLARIAHQHHISVAKLRAANVTLKGDMLHIGQKLVIPARTETASTSEPAKTETTDSSVAAAAPTHVHASSGPNRTLLGDSIPDATDKPMAGTEHDQTLVAPPVGGHHTYTVVKGDTLSKIAHRFHTTSSALMAANGSLDARKLRIGQKIHIPSQEPRSATSTPAAVPQMQQQQQPERIEPRATPVAQLANIAP
jgi:LysM repeat protein